LYSNPVLQFPLRNLLPQDFPHGGGVEAAAKSWGCDVAEVLDLSTGLHPWGTPDWLGEWLKSHVDLVGIYPDVHGEPARSVLAEYLDVLPEQILIVAGAQAVIEVVFQAMDWKSMGIQVPCYNEPIRCAQRAGCAVHAFEAGEQLPATEMLWVTNPSNPFGEDMIFPEERIGVLDESYMPFEQRKKMGLIEGVIRLGSLTKTFCIPGLRLGYVVADAQTIIRLQSWLSPWPAATLGLHVLPKLLLEAQARDAHIVSGRTRLQRLLDKHGWDVKPSQASFVLAKPHGDMPNFAAHHILVRTFPEWPQLSGWVRFGLPHSDLEWQRLSDALCL